MDDVDLMSETLAVAPSPTTHPRSGGCSRTVTCAASHGESIVDVLDRRAAEHPQKLLYSFLDFDGVETERHSYASFVKRTHAIASRLVDERGHRAGDRVLLAYPPGLEMVAALFGCIRAGLIPVPVPPLEVRGAAASVFRIEHLARDCDARAILSTAQGVFQGGRRFAKHGTLDLPWIATETRNAEHVPRVDTRAGPIAFLQYTSGSTSAPRGVLVSHANLLHNANVLADHPDVVAVTWLPQHHDMGLIGYYLNTPLLGGSCYGFSPSTFVQKPLLWLETISRVRATASSAPNFAYEYCLRPNRLRKERLAKLDLSSLKILMAAAEPIKPDTYRRFLSAFRPYGLDPEAFMVAYGLAENTLAVTSYGRRTLSVRKRELGRNVVRVTETASDIARAMHLMSCGRPLGNIRVEIVCPDTGTRLPDGTVGEIWIAGPSKCLGYWNDPQGTTLTFEASLAEDVDLPGRYLRTGDRGFLHDGELYVCGRSKDLIIQRGQNIYPQDVEAVAEASCPGIRSGCSAAFEAEIDGEAAVVLLAEVGARAECDPIRVVQAVRATLGVELAELLLVAPREIPKTSSGKVRRFEARLRYLRGSLTVRERYRREPKAAARDDARSPFSSLLARYQLTGTEEETLVELGVDSLDLVGFMHELQELLGDNGAGQIADQVDARLVQNLTVAESVELARALERRSAAAVLEVRQRLAKIRAEQRSRERRQMTEDRKLSFAPDIGKTHDPAAAPRCVLVTGATGFLGPFLVASLLEQTEARIVSLVRAMSPEEGMRRLRSAMRRSGLAPGVQQLADARVEVLCGDLDQPRLGLGPGSWQELSARVDTVFHNGALVNYLFDYARMRAANVTGTEELLRFACEGTAKIVNFVSTTFIFGWATKPFLLETDTNDGMELLDFGYSQTKWVSERLVQEAGDRGLPVRIFRPALITPSVSGDGNNFDITIRLLCFMLKHGIGVTAKNQTSFLPVDVTANNIVAISGLADTIGQTFHVTRDDYSHITDVTDLMTRQTGRPFEHFDIKRFVPEVIRRCTKDDLLFPLLDFLINSVDNIASMEFKRYDSTRYQAARDRSPFGKPDPSLEDTVAGIVRFMERNEIL